MEIKIVSQFVGKIGKTTINDQSEFKELCIIIELLKNKVEISEEFVVELISFFNKVKFRSNERVEFLTHYIVRRFEEFLDGEFDEIILYNTGFNMNLVKKKNEESI